MDPLEFFDFIKSMQSGQQFWDEIINQPGVIDDNYLNSSITTSFPMTNYLLWESGGKLVPNDITIMDSYVQNFQFRELEINTDTIIGQVLEKRCYGSTWIERLEYNFKNGGGNYNNQEAIRLFLADPSGFMSKNYKNIVLYSTDELKTLYLNYSSVRLVILKCLPRIIELYTGINGYKKTKALVATFKLDEKHYS